MNLLAFTVVAFVASADSVHVDDYQKSEGIWRMVSITDDGIKLREASIHPMTVAISGNTYTVRVADKVVERGVFVLDAAQSPKTIDATVLEGQDRGKTSLGIYSLDNDTRRVCLAAPGKDRPSGFESVKGSKRALFITRREGREEATEHDLQQMQGEWSMQAMERDGKKLPDQLVKTYKRTVKQNRYIVTWLEDGHAELLNTVMFLDATKNPKAVDVLLRDGPFKGKKRLGIYKIEGDVETVCLAQPGKERPKSFDSKQGALHVWMRAKP
jgi:uncharacterized protein (TIGR03067 family)